LAANIVASRQWLPEWLHANEREQRILAVIVGLGFITLSILSLFHVISN
jgi:hypothetical protein